jgi:hypothetical protein
MRRRNGSRAGLAQAASAVLMAGLSLSTIGAGAQTSKPIINIARVILAEPAVETPLPIQIGPADAIPQQTFLRIRGLPATATLSEGHSIAAGSWAIPLTGLARLKILTPVGASGRSEITISLVAIDGKTLSEAKATLLVAPATVIAGGIREQGTGQPGTNTASLGPSPVAPSPGSRVPQQDTRPPVPPGPQLSPEEREQALRFMKRGDESMVVGNITVARLFYQKAAELGWGQGAFALASTYDPNELARWNVVGGIQPDRETALKWYEKARELGTPEAVERLQRLGAAPR